MLQFNHNIIKILPNNKIINLFFKNGVKIVSVIEYFRYKNSLKKFYIKDNLIKSDKISLNNLFDLEINYYKTNKEIPNFSQGIITNNKTFHNIYINRNYSDFPFLFITHTNGRCYLICGEEYQGFTVVNLNTQQKINHFSKGYLTNKGFCPYEWLYDRDNNYLNILGCDYYGKEEIITYDFHNPDKEKYKRINL